MTTRKAVLHDSPLPIHTQIRDILLDEIARGLFRPGKRFPSERELAERFKVSRASVRETIGELTSTGVLFRTVGRGTFVNGKPPESTERLIALLISEDIYGFAESGYSRILHGVEEVCHQSGHLLFFQSVGPEGIRLPKNKKSPDGIIVVGGVRSSILQKLEKNDVPIVLVDLLIGTKNDTPQTVNIDYASGTRMALECLYSLGHRSIGFIGFAGSEKYESYWMTQQRLGLQYEPRHVELLNPIDLGPGILAGFQAMRRIIGRGEMPTAMLVTNDYVAHGAMEALHTADIKVPGQVSIVGFDDLGISTSPPLTTVHADLEAVGAVAMESLLRRLNGENSIEPIQMPMTLMERGSSAEAPQALANAGKSAVHATKS